MGYKLTSNTHLAKSAIEITEDEIEGEIAERRYQKASKASLKESLKKLKSCL
jgi:hypothetical protein